MYTVYSFSEAGDHDEWRFWLALDFCGKYVISSEAAEINVAPPEPLVAPVLRITWLHVSS